MRAACIAIALVLIAPATAVAGGFATVGVEPPPAGLGPGDTWNAEMTVMQHGVTPMEDATPVLMIGNGEETASFVGVETGEPGVYRAEVTFPGAGEWRYTVSDPFGVDHAFAAVQVDDGGTAASGADDGNIPLALVAALSAALLAAVVTALVRRRREPIPA